jgi:hypothetical protein
VLGVAWSPCVVEEEYAGPEWWQRVSGGNAQRGRVVAAGSRVERVPSAVGLVSRGISR